MNIIIANDHGGTELAKSFYEKLLKDNHSVNWLGTKDEKSVDYSDQALKACNLLLDKKNNYDFAIVVCGTGIGISIACNKIKGIRCALVQNIFASTMAKMHNNANVIAFGGRIDYQDDPYKMLQAFMNSSFEGGRHQRRIDKVMEL